MVKTNRFSLTLESLARLAPRADENHLAAGLAVPSLNEVLAEFAPLPHAALLLGLATDGLPILLNLLDALPGPIMITGDEGCGKTNFLRTIASSVNQTNPSNGVSYLVVSNNTSEWMDAAHSGSCEAVLSAHESNVVHHLHSLVEWAHSNRGGGQIYLVLIDHLEALITESEAQQDLRWLLLRGPSRRIWPIITVNSAIAVSDLYRPWLDAFRTRLFGSIENDRITQFLTGSSHVSFASLIAGFQFAMREGNDWLPFWIPALE